MYISIYVRTHTHTYTHTHSHTLARAHTHSWSHIHFTGEATPGYAYGRVHRRPFPTSLRTPSGDTGHTAGVGSTLRCCSGASSLCSLSAVSMVYAPVRRQGLTLLLAQGVWAGVGVTPRTFLGSWCRCQAWVVFECHQ